MNYKINYKYYTIAFGMLTLIVIILFSINGLINSLIDDYHLWNLSLKAHDDLVSIESNLINSKNTADSLKSLLSKLQTREYPDLQTIKKLAGDYKLRLRSIERLSNSDEEQSNIKNYTATLEGSVGGIVRYLKILGESYILESKQLSLRSVNKEGSVVALYIILKVRAS